MNRDGLDHLTKANESQVLELSIDIRAKEIQLWLLILLSNACLVKSYEFIHELTSNHGY